jgi:glycosyltransferase involved in cell wall biosynthesis
MWSFYKERPSDLLTSGGGQPTRRKQVWPIYGKKRWIIWIVEKTMKCDHRVGGFPFSHKRCSDRKASQVIVFLVRSLGTGGAERQLTLATKELYRRGYHVAVVSLYQGGHFEGELRKTGVPVFVVGKKGRWDVVCFVIRVVRLAKKIRPALIVGFLGAGNIVAVLLKALLPKLKVIWEVRAATIWLEYYDWIWRLEKILMRALAPVPDKIIVNSKAGFWELTKEGYRSSKIVVIPNGIDIDLFCPNRETGKELRLKWCGGHEGRLLGMVARLDPMKDHETFMRAAACLLEKTKDVKFVCVGPDRGGRIARFRFLAEMLGISDSLVWAGEHAEMAPVYNALDVNTLCSVGEGFPNAAAEAMACGVPCVVTDVGDCANLVGDTGIVVPPRDPVALARAWERCLGMDLEEMGKRARERIVKHFTVDRMVDETVKVFEEVLGRPLERLPATSDGFEG